MRDAGTCYKRKLTGGLGETKRPNICAPMTNHPIICLLPRQDRQLKAGHPWAFSNEIAMAPKHRDWPKGLPVRLEGAEGWRDGTFVFNPQSLIAARLLDHDPATRPTYV